jgi:hypothetical protein
LISEDPSKTKSRHGRAMIAFSKSLSDCGYCAMSDWHAENSPP